MRFYLKYILLTLFFLIQGCASTPPPDARKYAENKQWLHAYGNVIFNLSKNKKEDTERMIALTKEYPEIVGYGVEEYSFENLKDSDEQDYIQYRKDNVRYFCVIASEEQCNKAIANIAAAEKIVKKKIIVLKDLYDQLSPKEQQNINSKYKLIFYNSFEIGIVTDRQVRTINTPGSNAGAEIGGAVGTAAYINKATPSNYSMKNDLGSTAVGALVGALLMNKSPTTQYVTTHTIKFRNGEVKTFEDIANKPLGEGIGTCVRSPGITAIDSSFCLMTLADFKVKYFDDIKN